MPHIAIILPTYNGAPYLEAQVRSILDQSHADFEILAIDDGSSDGTPDLLRTLAAADGRIRLIPSTGNLGQVNRINQALALATSPFLCIADQDDIWEPTRNERLLEAIGDRPMAFGQSVLIDRDGREIGGTLLDALASDADASAPLKALFRPLVSAHGMLVRRDWVGGWQFGGALPFDEALALDALFSGGLVYVPQAIVRHRIHGGNQSNGSVVDGAAAKLSIRHLRTAASFRQPTRLHLWRALTCLGESPRVDAAFRHQAAKLAGQAFDQWYSQRRQPRYADGALRSALETVFRPWAGSADDWRYFSERLDIVTRSMLHPSNLRQTWWQAR